MTLPVASLEEKLGYRFRNRELLRRALTHRSWFIESRSSDAESGDNEQFEFLGDSILGFIVSESLIRQHPSADEGQLSQWKAHLVSARHLHGCALVLGLGEHLLLGKGEDRTGGRERRALLANAFEALIAAVHIDGGIDAARELIEQHVLASLKDEGAVMSIELLNHKSLVQEKTQALGLPVPRYSITHTSGPEHAKIFTVEARVGNQYVSSGQGSSKKLASQRAAQLLLEQLATAREPDVASGAGN